LVREILENWRVSYVTPHCPNQIPELVKLNVEFLKKVLDSLGLNRPDLWQALDNFISTNVDEEISKYNI